MPSTNDFNKIIRQETLAYQTNTEAFPQQVHMVGDTVMVASSKKTGPVFYTPAKIASMYVIEKEHCLQYYFSVVFFDDYTKQPIDIPWYRVLPDMEATK